MYCMVSNGVDLETLFPASLVIQLCAMGCHYVFHTCEVFKKITSHYYEIFKVTNLNLFIKQ